VALSVRLGTLREHYHQHQTIWDIGCDHGLLGLSFLGLPLIEKIHLVDPSPLVIKTLKDFIDSYITKDKILIALHEKKGQEITPGPEKKLMFIAGMGGKEIGSITEHLIPYLTVEDDLVISPHRDILSLRMKLHQSNFSLVRETLVIEDGQFYQILSLSLRKGPKVHLYGETIFMGESGQTYRLHQLNTFSAHQDERSGAYVEYLKTLTPRI
jgi:tRNA (adenine22-N1)-methyltransferase